MVPAYDRGEIKERFEDCEEAIKEYEKQLGFLKDDLEVVLYFSNVDILALARQQMANQGTMSNLANAPVSIQYFARSV